MKTPRYIIIAAMIGGLAAHGAAQSIPAGEKISFFAWKRTADQSANYGYYGLAEVTGSQSQGSAETVGAVSEIQGMPKWLELITDRYADTRLVIDDRKPASVANCSDTYDACPWIRSISLILDGGARDCRFEFPLLRQAGGFNQYDYFTITVDDSLDLQFHCVEDNVLMGSFLNTKYRDEPDRWLAGKAAIRALIDTASALGIGTIELDGRYRDLLQTYLGVNLNEFDPDADFYGIDFLDTAFTSSTIRIDNFTVSGASPRKADSTYALSWSFGADETVAFCSLFVSLDNAATWQPVARLGGAAEAYNWTAPPLDADSVFLEVRAYDGARDGSARSARFALVGNQPFSLSARAITSSSVELAWNPGALDAGARGVCIAWSDAGVPAHVSGADTLLYPLAVALDTLDGLVAGKRYYFAAFIQNAAGQFTAGGKGAVDSAIIADKTAPANVYTLIGSRTDPETIELSWEALAAVDPDAQYVGVWYGATHYPAGPGDVGIVEVGLFPPRDSVHSIAGLSSGAYYFSLCVGDSAGNWSGATEAARARVYAGGDDRGAVALSAGDSVSLFGDSIALVGLQTLPHALVDTLDYWDASSARDGFIAISRAYAFRTGNPAAANALTVDIACDGLPAGVAAGAIRLYRFDIERGVWLLDKNDGAYNVSTGRFRALLENPGHPFAVMVDTLAPRFEAKTEFDARTFISTERVFDTVAIIDNAGGAQLRLIAGPGSDRPIDFSLYVAALADSGARRRFQTGIPPYVADECSGLRAYLIADDGVNRDTINISRRIARRAGNCDNRTLTPLQWTPLIVSAQPASADVASLFARSTGAGSWRYDPDVMRLIRWDPRNGTWLEYSQQDDALFTLAPGALMWAKSRDAVSLDYGEATTMSLHDTVAVTLAPNAWTDFGVPYAFDLVLRDILDASSNDETLELYAWKAADNSYRTDPLFIGVMPGLDDSTIRLTGKTGYAAYNASSQEATLRLPPVCASMALRKRNAARARGAHQTKAGSIRLDIAVSDGETLSPVYCGFAAGVKARYFKQAPSLGNHAAGVVKTNSARLAGHALYNLKNGGAAYEIALCNGGDTPARLSGALGERHGLARSMRSALFDAEKGEWIDETDTVRATVPAGGRHTVFVVTGGDKFFRNFEGNFQFQTMKLRDVYPNPFAGRFTVAFTVPFRGVRNLDLALYDTRGRRIWRKNLKSGLTPGLNAVAIADRFHSGAYILRVSANVAGETKPRVFTRMVTCAR